MSSPDKELEEEQKSVFVVATVRHKNAQTIPIESVLWIKPGNPDEWGACDTGEPYLLVRENGKVTLEHQYGAIGKAQGLLAKHWQPPYESYLIPISMSEDDLNQEIDSERLFIEVLNEVKTFVDAPEDLQILIANLIMLSYITDLFQTVPYLFIVGDNESGKGQVLLIFNYLGYRPLLSPSLPAADIFRYLGEGESTSYLIMEDEADTIDRDPDKVKILRAGYKKGAKVPRIDEHGNQKFFDIFGVKVAVAEKLPSSKRARGLLERFLVFTMSEGTPIKDEFTRSDLERFRPLRLRLLLWRLKIISSNPTFDGNDYPWLRKRPRELWKALLKVGEMVGCENKIKPVLGRWLVQRKAQRKNTLEAFLIRVATDLVIDKKTLELEFGDIWAKIKTETGAVELVDRPNTLETEDYGFVTKNKVGLRLHDILGATSNRIWKDKRTYVSIKLDPTHLIREAKKYAYRLTDLPTAVESMKKKQLKLGDSGGQKAENNEIQGKTEGVDSTTVGKKVSRYGFVRDPETGLGSIQRKEAKTEEQPDLIAGLTGEGYYPEDEKIRRAEELVEKYANVDREEAQRSKPKLAYALSSIDLYLKMKAEFNTKPTKGRFREMISWARKAIEVVEAYERFWKREYHHDEGAA